MAKFLYVASSAGGRNVTDPGSGFCAVSGQWQISTAEDDAVLIIRGAFTASGLHVRVASNSFSSASSYHTRINAADGNLDVTIPATSSGAFEDTTNSDSLADGDLFNMEIVLSGMHGNSVDWLGAMVAMENAIDNRCNTMCFSPGETKSQGSTSHMAVSGDPFDTPFGSATTRWSFRGDRGELTNITFYVFANSIDGAGTFTLQIDAVDGNNQVTIPGNSTGRFEDTTSQDDAAGAGEDFAYELIGGADAMGDIMTYAMASILWNIEGGRPWVNFGQASQAFFLQGTTTYMGLEGSTNDAENGSTTESEAQVPARFPLIAENLYVRATPNTLNAASTVTFRVNGADTALAVTLPSSSGGVFEDTTDAIFVDTGDAITLEFDMSVATSGSVQIVPFEVEQQQPDDMSWRDPMSPPVFERIIEVLAY